ncbi:hypothetical protein ACIQUW_14380 [Streptomyces sp. NPDC101117]|uniref:hypothetical protein n=1 Tax=Streptomyces sp. NPDC101117 TaxID=3366108 RepID=UPI003808AA61
MSTEQSRSAREALPAPGALLLCRAEPDSVAPVARLLREDMLLAPAGEGWSVLVPEGRPWQDGGEPLDRVLSGWALALAVGAPWPALALWWDAERAGYSLASGFRRPVGYEWLANGTPVGVDEAMHTFAGRLGLDPVLDVQSLDELTRPDPASDARSRLRGLLAVLQRAGVDLPDGLAPGDSADLLCAAAREWPHTRPAQGAHRPEGDRTHPHGTQGDGPGPRPPWAGGPWGGMLALVQIAAGLPLTAWGLHRRSGGWTAAGALLLAHGALGLACAPVRPLD